MKNNLNRLILIGALAVILAACGGSGSGSTTSVDASAAPSDPSTPGAPSDPSTPSTPAAPSEPSTPSRTEFNVEEFVGTWSGDSSICLPKFSYAESYYYRVGTLTLTDSTAKAEFILFNDAACASKAGKITETSSVEWSSASFEGKTNVGRAKLTTSPTFGVDADGGTGFVLSGVPEGTGFGFKGMLLLDVDSNKLYGPANSALDSDGFPSALSTTSFATKQQ